MFDTQVASFNVSIASNTDASGICKSVTLPAGYYVLFHHTRLSGYLRRLQATVWIGGIHIVVSDAYHDDKFGLTYASVAFAWYSNSTFTVEYRYWISGMAAAETFELTYRYGYLRVHS